MMDARSLLDLFKDVYGEGRWWSDDPFTVMFQTVLVQNASWSGVQKVAVPDAHDVLKMSLDGLETLVRPCGFHRAKARTISSLAMWFSSYGFSGAAVETLPALEIRRQLLAISGIGEESADDILVYAFHKPRMIVDAYTRRLLWRMEYVFDDDEGIRAWAGESLEDDVTAYGHLHWHILEHCIRSCRKRPSCASCPLTGVCTRRFS